MPRLIDLLGLVEQKKNLYSPGMTVQELAWTEEEQHYFWLHYKLEGEMDTAPWTIEALLQAVRNHEAMRAEPIARYKKYR